jgi:hypothetical protein
MNWKDLEAMIDKKNEFGLCNIEPCSELATYRSRDNSNPSIQSGRYCTKHYEEFLKKGQSPKDFVPIEYYETGN